MGEELYLTLFNGAEIKSVSFADADPQFVPELQTLLEDIQNLSFDMRVYYIRGKYTRSFRKHYKKARFWRAQLREAQRLYGKDVIK